MQTEHADYLKNLCRNTGIEILHYAHPMKALDNLSELNPDYIVWNADDFPRHWKAVRASTMELEKSPHFAIVSDHAVSDDEIKKAEALGVTPVFSEGFLSERFTAWIKAMVSTLNIDIPIHELRFAEGRIVFKSENGVMYLASDLTISPAGIRTRLKIDSIHKMPSAGLKAHATIGIGDARHFVTIVIQKIENDGHIAMTVVSADESYFDLLRN